MTQAGSAFGFVSRHPSAVAVAQCLLHDVSVDVSVPEVVRSHSERLCKARIVYCNIDGASAI